MLRRSNVFVAAVAAASVAGIAHAGGTKAEAAQGIKDLSELNLVVFGDVNASGQETEGPMFVGGDLNGSGYQVDFGATHASQGFTASSFQGLTVLGNVTGDVHLNSGVYDVTAHSSQTTIPNLYVAGSVSGTIGLNANNLTVEVGGNIASVNGSSGSTVQAGGTIGSSNRNGAVITSGVSGLNTSLTSQITAEKSSLSTDLNALATQLDLLTATGSYEVPNQNDNQFIASDPTHLGYTVIDITVAQLEATRNIDFSGLGSTTTIIDVTGITANSVYTFDANSNNSAYNQQVIWNFGETAATLHFDAQMNGSILAPNDVISNSTPLEGSVVAETFDQDGEVHLGTFEGTNPFPTVIPEPNTWAMLLVGVAMVGLAARRRGGWAVAAQ